MWYFVIVVREDNLSLCKGDKHWCWGHWAILASKKTYFHFPMGWFSSGLGCEIHRVSPFSWGTNSKGTEGSLLVSNKRKKVLKGNDETLFDVKSQIARSPVSGVWPVVQLSSVTFLPLFRSITDIRPNMERKKGLGKGSDWNELDRSTSAQI